VIYSVLVAGARVYFGFSGKTVSASLSGDEACGSDGDGRRDRAQGEIGIGVGQVRARETVAAREGRGKAEFLGDDASQPRTGGDRCFDPRPREREREFFIRARGQSS